MDSAIISNPDDRQYVFQNLTNKKNVKLLYRGSSDGFGAQDFHRKCDGVNNTLTFIKTDIGHIIGGYTSIAWTSSDKPYADPTAFVFLMNLRSIYFIKDPATEAIYDRKDYGPSFGSSYYKELYVASDFCNINRDSWIRLNGDIYQKASGYATHFFTGTYFKVLEIEVFALV